MPTPVSVSLGRDLKRLLETDRIGGAMQSPEDRLRYILETGEPTFRSLEMAPRNRFSACVRPLGKQAIESTPQ